MSVQTEQTISSLEIAELTGKEHAHVMRDIRNILSRIDEINQSNFGLVKYTDAKGEEHPMYNLTKSDHWCMNTKTSQFVHSLRTTLKVWTTPLKCLIIRFST